MIIPRDSIDKSISISRGPLWKKKIDSDPGDLRKCVISI